jgi:hypothetical protein
VTAPLPARRRWHPVVSGGGLLAAALGLAAAVPLAGVPRPGAGWVAPIGWLLLGVTAGFATSGST